jgi:predicted permease
MNNIVILIVCFMLGQLVRHSGQFSDSTHAMLNRFIVCVSLPAMTLLYIHDMAFSKEMIWVGLMAWLVFGFSVLFFWFVGRWIQLSRATTAGLMLTGGLGNTSFFGLPMVEAFYGKAGLSTAIIASQLGSFLVLSIVGIAVAGAYSGGRPNMKDIVKRIAQFPPSIALLTALLITPLEYAHWFTVLLERLSSTLAPLSLISVGMQFHMGHILEHKRELTLGLNFKLIIAPLLMYLLYVQLLGAHGQSVQVTVFESAMPPMITASILASEHGLNPPLVNLMAGVGLLVSFVTLAGWWLALARV